MLTFADLAKTPPPDAFTFYGSNFVGDIFLQGRYGGAIVDRSVVVVGISDGKCIGVPFERRPFRTGNMVQDEFFTSDNRQFSMS